MKIEKYADEYSTTIRLIGRVQAEHLAELKTQIEESGPKIAMDLEEVDLVDVEVVRFLGRVKHKGSSSSTARPTYTTGSAKNAIRARVRICVHDRHVD